MKARHAGFWRGCPYTTEISLPFEDVRSLRSKEMHLTSWSRSPPRGSNLTSSLLTRRRLLRTRSQFRRRCRHTVASREPGCGSPLTAVCSFRLRARAESRLTTLGGRCELHLAKLADRSQSYAGLATQLIIRSAFREGLTSRRCTPPLRLRSEARRIVR